MRKPFFFGICENKDADQLHSTAKLISAFFFRHTDSAIPLLDLNPKFQVSSHLLWLYLCTVRFVSDLVGNPEDLFSHNEAHIVLSIL